MSFYHHKSTIMKLAEIPIALGLEVIVAILSLIALFLPTQWVFKKINAFREKRKRLENLDKIVVGKIENIETTVKDISKEVKILSARQIAIISMDDRPTFICDETGSCVFANNELCSLFGAQLQSMLGFGWSSFIHEDDRERALHEWTTALINDIDIVNKYRIRHAITGEILQLKYRAIISRDNDRKITHIVGSVYLDDEA